MDNTSYIWSSDWNYTGTWTRIIWIKPYLSAMEQVTVLVNLSGVICNVPVLIIFFKDGFSSNANICFFSLALVDIFISAFYLIWRGWEIAINWGFVKVQTSFLDLQMYASKSTDSMNCVSSWITALITLERLLCILFPLKVS